MSLIQKRQTARTVCPKNLPGSPDSLLLIVKAKIRKFRNALMLSQAEFAAWLGVSRELLAAIELGTRKPKQEINFVLTPENASQLLRQVIFIRLFRESGLNQTDFAAKTGLIQADISKYLKHQKPVSSRRIQRITEALNISPEPLLKDFVEAQKMFDAAMKEV